VEQHTRLAARGWLAEQITQRMAAQWPVEQKIARAHHVLWTEGSMDSSARQVVRVFERL